MITSWTTQPWPTQLWPTWSGRSRRSRLLADRATAEGVAERCGYDLPPASWALLEHLDARGPLRVSDIAACHGIDVSSVTPRLKRLESAGLVLRGRTPSDARAFLISIAPEGALALERVHAARQELLREALAGSDLAHLTATTEILDRIAAHLSRTSLPELPSPIGAV